jgi:hypothetical protein
VKHSSIPVLFVMVALFDLELEQLDVKITFLHNELEKRIYITHLEGFIAQGKEDHVCLLKKSLYGLKKSLKQWYKRFDTFMLRHCYFRNDYDSCMYFKKLSYDILIVYLLLYIYDMLIASKNIPKINSLND